MSTRDIATGCLLCFVLVFGCRSEAESPPPPVLQRIEQAVAADDYYAYASTAKALNPCIDAPSILGQPWEPGEAERLRSRLPARACDDDDLRKLVPRLFLLQSLVLAATTLPLETYAAIATNRSNLARCSDLKCAKAEVEEATLDFVRRWEALPQAASRAASPRATAIRSSESALRRAAPKLLSQFQTLCGSRFGAGMVAFGTQDIDRPQALLTCDRGGTDAPGWLLEKHHGRWIPVLQLQAMGNLRRLASRHSGRVDLMNSVRVNAGEHPASVFIHDGKRYVERLRLDIQSISLGEIAVISTF